MGSCKHILVHLRAKLGGKVSRGSELMKILKDFLMENYHPSGTVSSSNLFSASFFSLPMASKVEATSGLSRKSANFSNSVITRFLSSAFFRVSHNLTRSLRIAGFCTSWRKKLSSLAKLARPSANSSLAYDWVSSFLVTLGGPEESLKSSRSPLMREPNLKSISSSSSFILTI